MSPYYGDLDDDDDGEPDPTDRTDALIVGLCLVIGTCLLAWWVR